MRASYIKKAAVMEKKKRRWTVKLLKILLVTVFLVLFFNLLRDVHFQYENKHSIPRSEEWNLIVVNRWNKLPEDYYVELTELENGQKVDSRIYPYLQEMFEDARAEGVYPVVREAYRTAEEQQGILFDRVQSYISEGYSRWRAERIAKEWVALPGTSEHQLGIAVDINADRSKCRNEDVYLWLSENAYKYGFILRYPEEKQEITGTNYEPWHYRYVGVEAAQEIYEQGVCLEEYILNHIVNNNFEEK